MQNNPVYSEPVYKWVDKVDDIAVKFFYWWYNQKGSNTAEGFKDFKKTDIYKEWLKEINQPVNKINSNE